MPSLVAVQDTSGFFHAYYAESDTLDKVHVTDVRDAESVAAALALGIAKLPERFGERLPKDAVREWLRRAGLDRHLRLLGVWDAWYGRAGRGVRGWSPAGSGGMAGLTQSVQSQQATRSHGQHFVGDAMLE